MHIIGMCSDRGLLACLKFLHVFILQSQGLILADYSRDLLIDALELLLLGPLRHFQVDILILSIIFSYLLIMDICLRRCWVPLTLKLAVIELVDLHLTDVVVLEVLLEFTIGFVFFEDQLVEFSLWDGNFFLLGLLDFRWRRI